MSRCMHFGNFTDIKRITQNFSDCGLHYDKYKQFSYQKNCGLHACIESLMASENLRFTNEGKLFQKDVFIVGIFNLNKFYIAFANLNQLHALYWSI